MGLSSQASAPLKHLELRNSGCGGRGRSWLGRKALGSMQRKKFGKRGGELLARRRAMDGLVW